jgi:hypothetical protein
MANLTRLAKTLPFIFLLLSSLIMVQAIVIYGKDIGLFDDAMWDFTPAVGMLNGAHRSVGQEINILGYPLPIVSGPYSGALKIWILAPMLMLLGTIPHVVLALNVLFGFAYLLALYWALLPAVGRAWASLVFLIPLIDTNYLITTPLDDGIFLVQYIFISLSMGALLRYLSSNRLKYYYLAWLFNGLLLAQKLTAIPIVASLAATAGVLSCREFLRTARARQWSRAVTRFLVIPAALFLVPMVPQIAYFIKSGFGPLHAMTADASKLPYLTGLSHGLSFFTRMFDGADWFHRVTVGSMSGVPTPPILAAFGITVIVCSFLIYLAVADSRKGGRYMLVCLGVTVGSILLYPTVRGLYRPWHYYVLAPVFFCAVVAASAHCASFCRIKCGRYAAAVFAVLFVAAASGVVLGSLHGIRVLRGIESLRGACVDSPAINDFYRTIAASNIRTVYAVNYSLANPIYLFSKGTIRAENLAWTELTGDKIEELFRKIKLHPEAAVVYRYCRDKSVETQWIQWLNREPEIYQLFRKLESEEGNVSLVRCVDARQTEFVLIRR